MGGIALLFLATFYYAVDIKKVTWWTSAVCHLWHEFPGGLGILANGHENP